MLIEISSFQPLESNLYVHNSLEFFFVRKILVCNTSKCYTPINMKFCWKNSTWKRQLLLHEVFIIIYEHVLQICKLILAIVKFVARFDSTRVTRGSNKNKSRKSLDSTSEIDFRNTIFRRSVLQYTFSKYYFPIHVLTADAGKIKIRNFVSA